MSVEIILEAMAVSALLFASHCFAFKTGWDMGIKRDPSVPLSKPKAQTPPREEYVDPYDKERLDFE